MLKDKLQNFEIACKVFFQHFGEAFAKSDKKTFKDNMNPMFGNADTCLDYVNVSAFPKFEDKPPEKWNEFITSMPKDEEFHVKALSQKDESTMINPD